MHRASRVVGIVAIVGAGMFGATSAPAAPYPYGGDGAFQLRVGGFFPDGDGDLTEINEAYFTQDTSDFDDWTIGLTLVHAISNNLELGLNFDFYDSIVRTQYRIDCDPFILCVDENGRPIYHDAELSTVPLTVDLRLIPGGRYRQRGARAVLKPVFYVGAGMGVNWWEYEEVGDFIDFDLPEPEIFPAHFRDSGAAFEAHVLAGIELPLGRATNFQLEGRQSWADDRLSGDFEGLGEIDLSGTSVTMGLSFRF